jgi:hypothetical protein
VQPQMGIRGDERKCSGGCQRRDFADGQQSPRWIFSTVQRNGGILTERRAKRKGRATVIAQP